MEWYLKVLNNYAVFSGRARRKEYWMFLLVNFFAAMGVGFVAGMIGMPLLSNLYTLGVLIPGIAVGVRRIQDTNHSAWYLLIPFYNLYLLCQDSDPNQNQYGPNPKSPMASAPGKMEKAS